MPLRRHEAGDRAGDVGEALARRRDREPVPLACRATAPAGEALDAPIVPARLIRAPPQGRDRCDLALAPGQDALQGLDPVGLGRPACPSGCG